MEALVGRPQRVHGIIRPPSYPEPPVSPVPQCAQPLKRKRVAGAGAAAVVSDNILFLMMYVCM